MKISRIVIDNRTPVSTFSGFSKENLDLDNTFTDINDYSREITVATESIIDAVNDIDHLSKMAFSLENTHRFSRVDSQLVSLSLSKYRSKYGIASYEISTEDDKADTSEKASEQSQSFLGKIWDKIKALFKWIGSVFSKLFEKIGDFYRWLFNKKKEQKEEVEYSGKLVDYLKGDSIDMDKLKAHLEKYKNQEINPRYSALIKEGKPIPKTTSVKASDLGSEDVDKASSTLIGQRNVWDQIWFTIGKIKEVIDSNYKESVVRKHFGWEDNPPKETKNFWKTDIWDLQITLIHGIVYEIGDIKMPESEKLKDKNVPFLNSKSITNVSDLKSMEFFGRMTKEAKDWGEYISKKKEIKPKSKLSKTLVQDINVTTKSINAVTQLLSKVSKHEANVLKMIEKIIDESLITVVKKEPTEEKKPDRSEKPKEEAKTDSTKQEPAKA